MKNIILRTEKLCKHFMAEGAFGGARYKVNALIDASVEIEKGKILALVGESGSGKTTLARIIAGLETQDSGAVFLDGKIPDYKNPAERRKVQYVFQDTYYSLNPRMKIGNILAEPISIHFGIKKENISEKIQFMLQSVGLGADVMEKYPHELSGGQRQRVGIARALSVNPELLIADEPVSSLDVSVQAQILKLFSDLNEKNGISIIFITHDLRIVKSLADTVAVMNRGEIVEYGEVDEVYSNPRSEYTKTLLGAVKG